MAESSKTFECCDDGLRLLVRVAARRRRGLRRGRPGGQAEGSRPAGSLRP